MIPAGEYEGGDVIVWDTGAWTPVHTEDPGAAVRSGELHAEVQGKKLRGRLVLVRRGEGDEWMLLHKHDAHAVDGWHPEDHPTSVLSGRTNEEVTAARDRVWIPGETVEPLPDEAIDQIRSLPAKGTWEVFGRRLKVTNLDKVLFPGDPP